MQILVRSLVVCNNVGIRFLCIILQCLMIYCLYPPRVQKKKKKESISRRKYTGLRSLCLFPLIQYMFCLYYPITACNSFFTCIFCSGCQCIINFHQYILCIKRSRDHQVMEVSFTMVRKCVILNYLHLTLYLLV